MDIPPANTDPPPPPLPVPPELLAPAGDRDCVRAAIENGADAVYFGLENGFNARARAANLPAHELPELMAELHRRGVKGYVALNTLIFPAELPRIEQTLRAIAEAGADAVIIQDLGVARLARALCPDLPIHASTQMSLSSAEGVRMAEALGASRVVLARELSIAEVGKIRPRTTLELEVFVHGALCIGYSGQCLASRSLGGRSANRGQCAQACRMPYELICDGQAMDLGDRKYLLSPQDLAAYDLVPDLIAAGVNSLKIEGRMKSAEYVAGITRYYRLAIDAAAAGKPIQLEPEQVQEMEVSFSRGFSHGWLNGPDHKALVPGRSASKRGVLLGEVQRVRRGRVTVQLACPVKRGDGVVFEGDREDGAEQGGRVYEVFRGRESLTEPVASGQVELTFRHGAIDFSRLRPGQQVWKTDDPALSKRLQKSYAAARPQRRIPVDLVIQAAAGQPLQIVARAQSGATCSLESPQALAEAVRHPLTLDVLKEQLGRLGGTAYALGTVKATIVGAPIVPLSVLGQLRHELVRQLDAAATRPIPRRIADGSALEGLRAQIPAAASGQTGGARLHVLCRRLKQVEQAIDLGVQSLMADFRDIGQYGDAVLAAHAAGATILLATPRIHKPGETGLFKALLRRQPDGILVRNLAGLGFFGRQQVPMVADFSLNAANELTVHYLRRQGAQRATVSYDLSPEQVFDLAAAVPPDWLEVVVHQHMPMFHTEHCVFCAVLSPGTNKTDCGRPCDHHLVRLRDRMGVEHLLEADLCCRNTAYNGIAQSGPDAIPVLCQRGVRDFRVELPSDCGESQVRQVLGVYGDLFANRIGANEAWNRLKAAGRSGVTRGTWEERPTLR